MRRTRDVLFISLHAPWYFEIKILFGRTVGVDLFPRMIGVPGGRNVQVIFRYLDTNLRIGEVMVLSFDP